MCCSYLRPWSRVVGSRKRRRPLPITCCAGSIAQGASRSTLPLNLSRLKLLGSSILHRLGLIAHPDWKPITTPRLVIPPGEAARRTRKRRSRFFRRPLEGQGRAEPRRPATAASRAAIERYLPRRPLTSSGALHSLNPATPCVVAAYLLHRDCVLRASAPAVRLRGCRR